MKKELLIASALVSTMGVASVAEAVTHTISGHHRVGVEGESTEGSSTDTNTVSNQSAFSVALAETTDGGVDVATSFMLTNESSGVSDASALTLTFTDGSKLDVFNAGNSYAGHDISVPGSSGEAAVAVTTTNNSPSGLDFAGSSTALGVEWHSAADFMMDGLKVSASFSTDDGAAATATANVTGHWGLGATYVTDAGDTAITLGTGLTSSQWHKTGTALTNDENGYHVGVSAVTGDLTVAVGYSDGDSVEGDTTGGNREVTGNVTKAGVKYVTGDITLDIGMASGEGKDGSIGSIGTTNDTIDKTSASATYAVASGVSAILGYTSVDSSNDGADDGSGGSAWYVGALMSF